MGEIDHVQHAEYQGEADRHQRVHQSDGDAVDQLLEEKDIEHGLPARLR
jgi:hypothetical protein